MKINFLSCVVLSTLILSACSTSSPNIKDETPSIPTIENKALKITPGNFSALPHWHSDNFQNFASAYKKSCNRILKKPSQRNFAKSEIFGKSQEWQILCRKFEGVDKNNSNALRQFFETNFIPHNVAAGSDSKGLFTGYYEASLKGSRTRQGVYQVPLRARPDDLVMVQLGEFRDELKGQRIAGRVVNGKLKAYETHEQIVNNQMPSAQDKTLVWVDDAVDAFFLQIQGSGIVSLDDGTVMRVGYAGQNGHPYYAIGRELIARGALTKENVSMQSIRGWLEQNPDEANEIMFTNKSYVFFRELNGEGPLGGEGVPLTPMRSLAIDRSIIPYGMPVWLSTDHSQIQGRLMVTQDTGGAIRGPVRGDYFWGHGVSAENNAGTMKASGRYWFLLPKNL